MEQSCAHSIVNLPQSGANLLGDPLITDETLEQILPDRIQSGDIVGIGIHTGNALRGMQVGRMARQRGAWVVFGGIHATLHPEEVRDLGGAHVVGEGDGDLVWAKMLADLVQGTAQQSYLSSQTVPS